MRIFQYVFNCFKNIFGFRHCLDWRNGALEMVCRDNHPPLFLCNVIHFRVMSSTSKITKRDKQMYLVWTVPNTHLRHAFIQCCASFPLLRWEYLYAMAAVIKNMDSAITWPRYQTKKSEGSRVPDYDWSFQNRGDRHFYQNQPFQNYRWSDAINNTCPTWANDNNVYNRLEMSLHNRKLQGSMYQFDSTWVRVIWAKKMSL